MKSTGQRPVHITKNLQRPFWPQFEPVGKTPELHAFTFVLHGDQPNSKQPFLFLACMCMFLGKLRGRYTVFARLRTTLFYLKGGYRRDTPLSVFYFFVA